MGKFYNTSLKSWLKKKIYRNVFNNTEGKSVIAERFVRTLKNKIHEDMTSVSKNVYIDKLDDIVNKYINTFIAQLK